MGQEREPNCKLYSKVLSYLCVMQQSHLIFLIGKLIYHFHLFKSNLVSNNLIFQSIFPAKIRSYNLVKFSQITKCRMLLLIGVEFAHYCCYTSEQTKYILKIYFSPKLIRQSGGTLCHRMPCRALAQARNIFYN